MRGRNPIPNAEKAAIGTRASRMDTNEPTPAAGPPIMPEWLDGAAQEHWRLTLPRLMSMLAVTESDSDELGRYCLEMSLMIRAKKKVDEDGEVINSPNNFPLQNPWLAIYRKALSEAAKHGARLGLNPTNRGGVHAVSDQKAAKKSPASTPPVLRIAQ